MAALWREFSEATTVHGLRFVNFGQSLKRRLFWGALVLVGTALFASQFIETVGNYFKFKVNTVVYLSNDGNTKFPAITICNQNALRKSKLEANKHDAIVQSLLYMTRKFIDNSTSNKSTPDGHITGQQLRDLYFKYGHSMEHIDEGGMLEFCRTPDGSLCSAKDFVRTLTFAGLCYTLNSMRTAQMKTAYSSLSGNLASIRLILSTQVDEYSEAIGKSSSTGIRLLVHDQLDPPLADTHGMTIGPGVAASIGIRKQKIKSKKYPFESECDDKKLGPGVPYSRLGCLRRCQEKFVVKKCGCNNIVDTILNQTGIKRCDMDQTFMCALPAATETFNNQKIKCSCPFACESTEYIPTLSYSPYPSDIEGRKLAIKHLTKMKKNTTEEAIQEFIKEERNKIIIDIFYHQLDYLTMMHVPATTGGGLIAEIGGLLGISLGASFLTIIELLDFLFFYLFQKISKEKKSQTSVSSKETTSSPMAAI
ncbi:acid-sensing ion channel 3-like isoform X2 [Rhopilema esculentum]|uniref:acid-sensing ion channel 3-like isoform X2 n=1 Tax=Rhopilema esculentum TaxID=499914 RepID=UPI0031DFA4E5